MTQEKIKYRTIMDLGFTEELINDNVFFDVFGFQYSIITLELTKKIYLDWEKETQLCKLVRVDNTREHNIVGKLPMENIEHVKTMIDFYTNKSYALGSRENMNVARCYVA